MYAFKGVTPVSHSGIFSYDEIARIVKVVAPLARKGVSHLLSSLKKIKGIENLSLTTNGVLLESMAIDSERYREITRGGSLDVVLEGIEKAESAGLKPVKINMMPIRGFNDDEIGDFARLTLSNSRLPQ